MYCGVVRQVIHDERNGDLSSDARDVMKPSRFSFQASQITSDYHDLVPENLHRYVRVSVQRSVGLPPNISDSGRSFRWTLG